jgi:hypothetical protein
MSGIEENECRILESAQRCDRLFEILLEVLIKRLNNQGSASRSSELVLDYQRRLQFWAGVVGVNDEPLVRLDTRLRNKPDLRALTLQLLHLVETNLQRSKDWWYM